MYVYSLDSVDTIVSLRGQGLQILCSQLFCRPLGPGILSFCPLSVVFTHLLYPRPSVTHGVFFLWGPFCTVPRPPPPIQHYNRSHRSRPEWLFHPKLLSELPLDLTPDTLPGRSVFLLGPVSEVPTSQRLLVASPVPPTSCLTSRPTRSTPSLRHPGLGCPGTPETFLRLSSQVGWTRTSVHECRSPVRKRDECTGPDEGATGHLRVSVSVCMDVRV